MIVALFPYTHRKAHPVSGVNSGMVRLCSSGLMSSSNKKKTISNYFYSPQKWFLRPLALEKLAFSKLETRKANRLIEEKGDQIQGRNTMVLNLLT